DIAGVDGQWRTDDESRAAYSELLALCPPKKQECLGVPISRLKKYLLGQSARPAAADEDEDVEGAVREESGPESGDTDGRALLRCRNGSWEVVEASQSGDLLFPNDLVVVPMKPDGFIPEELGTNLDNAPIDRAEEAAWMARPLTRPRRAGGIFLRISKS
ncbi:MAG: hypothetical protein M1588_00515, partial [Planctomycetes bacterium]|nr:hypothetical protein [Planctomycetota bacterium]